MESDRRVGDLIHELVHRLHNTSNPNPNPSNVKYAARILSSRMTPSIAADESAMAYSIKSNLVKQGKLSDALLFTDLYSKLASKIGPGCVTNKWSILYLLKVISDDRKCSRKVITDNSRLSSYSDGGLPVLFEPETKVRNSKTDRNVVGKDNGGVLLVSRDSENMQEMAYREFAVIVKEENCVTEEVLVRDVLYACQGIDGKYVIFDESVDGYVLPDTIKVPKTTKVMVRKLCELGWLFRKVKGYVCECMERFHDEDVGTVAQAFCAALQDELSEYYKLLAVLQSQAMNPIPLVSENVSSGNYLSLRRLDIVVV